MSSFAVVYLLFPMIYKRIKSVDRGIILVVVTLCIKFVAPTLLNLLFMRWSLQSDMDLCGITPLSDLCYFSIGYLIALGEQHEMTEKYSYEKLKVIAILLALFVFQLRWELGWNVVISIGLIMTILIYFPISMPDVVVKTSKKCSGYTYALYIVHGFIYAELYAHFSYLKWYVLLLLMFICAVSVAFVVHHLIELPITKKFKKVYSNKG